jgi:hypothetical protein
MDEEGDRKALIARIGTFFLVIGMLGLILFIASDLGDTAYFQYFVIGIILLSAGLIFKRASAPPPAPSKRFEGIRKWQQIRRENKAKKEATKIDPKKKK